jgi:ATP-binding cassette, subfamily B, bacterial
MLSRLYSPIRGLIRLTNTAYAASAGAERVIEMLDAEPRISDAVGARPVAATHPGVEFRDVSFCYPSDEPEPVPSSPRRQALDGVCLRVEPGEVLALVGPSGAGKSTVARLLLRSFDPTSGQVLLGGQDLRSLTLRSVRDTIAVVLQETLVFDGTVRDNIAYGRPGATEEQIIAAARAADAHDFITCLPDGYATRIGERGTRLSGGQRQRLAIARAMVRDAPVLLLDEPTTGLDAASGQRMLEPMRRLMEGRATIVISHNLLTVQDATTILVLDGGRVVERGTHAELLRRRGLYARLHRLSGLAGAGDGPALSVVR